VPAGTFTSRLLATSSVTRFPTKPLGPLKNAMLGVCLIGELATAGFGMQVSGFEDAGMQLTRSELSMMVWVVRGLGFLHALALILAVAGDDIISAFQSGNSRKVSAPVSLIGFSPRMEEKPVDKGKFFPGQEAR